MSKDKKNSTKRLAAVFLAVFFFLALSGTVYLFFVPVDLTGLHKRIEAVIEARTGSKILLDRIVVQVLPAPDITIKGVRVFQGDQVIMSADSVRLKVALLPLLKNQPVIENLDIAGAEVSIKRDEKGVINIREFLRGFEENRPKKNFRIKSLNIKEGSIKITDAATGAPQAYTISHLNSYIRESKNGFSYGASALLLPGSRISASGEGTFEWDVIGAGSIKRVDLERLNPYLKDGPDEAFLKGTADLNFSYTFGANSYVKGVIRYKDLSAAPSALAKPLISRSGTAELGLLWDKDGFKEFAVNDARVLIDKSVFTGSFKLTGPWAHPEINLNFSASEIPFRNFKDLIPIKAINKDAADVINSLTPIGGNLTIKNLSVTGPLDAARKGGLFTEPVTIACDIILDDIKFRYQGLSRAFSGVTGGVSLKNGALSFKGAASYDNIAIDDLKWDLRDLGGKLPYDLRLRASLEAGDMFEKMREFTRVKAFDEVTASGGVDVFLNLKGELSGPAPVKYLIDSKVMDGKFAYEGFPVSFQSLNGGITFDNDKITFNGLGGNDGHSKLVLDGSIKDWSGKKPLFDLTGEGEAAEDSIAPFIKNTALEPLNMDGTIVFRGGLKGNKDRFSVTARLDTTPAGIEYMSFVKKAKSYPLTIESSFELAGKELSIKELKAGFGGSVLALDGDYSFDKRLYSLHVKARGVRIADLDNVSPYLTKDAEADGVVSFDLKTIKEGDNPTYEGEVNIKDGRFKTPLIAKPIERINAGAQFSGNDGIITIENISVGKSEVKATINIPDIANRVVIFDIFSPRLYLEDLVAFREGGKAPQIPRSTHPPPPRPGKVEKAIIGMGRINIRDGGAWDHPFHDFSTDVRISSNVIYFKPVQVVIDRGTVSGEAAYYASPSEPLVFETDMKVLGLNLEDMIAAFGVRHRVLTGNLNGRFTLSAKRNAVPFSSGLNGGASLRSDGGKLWQFLFLTKIFSVVNIFSINELFRTGLPYKTISGDFFLKDGIILTNNLVFYSHSMRMSTVGRINLPERSTESVIAVRPFVTLDYILSQIPLAGWIIQGREKSAVSFYFDVKGPLKNTDVEPVTIKGLSEGIFGILQRLIESPVKIIMPDLE